MGVSRWTTLGLACVLGLGCSSPQRDDFHENSVWSTSLSDDDAGAERPPPRPQRRVGMFAPAEVLRERGTLHASPVEIPRGDGTTEGAIGFLGSADRAESAWFVPMDLTRELVQIDGLPIGLRVLATATMDGSVFVLTETLSMRGRPAGLRSVLMLDVPITTDPAPVFRPAPLEWHAALATGSADLFTERTVDLPPLPVMTPSLVACRAYLAQVRGPDRSASVVSSKGLWVVRRFGTLRVAPERLSAPFSTPLAQRALTQVVNTITSAQPAEKCCTGGCDGLSTQIEGGRLVTTGIEIAETE